MIGYKRTALNEEQQTHKTALIVLGDVYEDFRFHSRDGVQWHLTFKYVRVNQRSWKSKFVVSGDVQPSTVLDTFDTVCRAGV